MCTGVTYFYQKLLVAKPSAWANLSGRRAKREQEKHFEKKHQTVGKPILTAADTQVNQVRGHAGRDGT